MKKLIIGTGERFGRLTIISEVKGDKHSRKFFVRCDCGTGKEVLLKSMRMGQTKSCGCINQDNPYAKKHGHNSRKTGPSRTYSTWSGLIQRCTNPKNRNYPGYGGRGIEVCKRWLVFHNFLKDMGEKPEGLVIDRIDNNKGYFPKNCRWTTVSQNNFNRRKWTIKKT